MEGHCFIVLAENFVESHSLGWPFASTALEASCTLLPRFYLLFLNLRGTCIQLWELCLLTCNWFSFLKLFISVKYSCVLLVILSWEAFAALHWGLLGFFVIVSVRESTTFVVIVERCLRDLRARFVHHINTLFVGSNAFVCVEVFSIGCLGVDLLEGWLLDAC